MGRLELRQVSKEFSGVPVLQGIDLDIQAGEFFSLLGPSGCGKTTLLRIIAGFEEATSGSVVFGGSPMDLLPAHRRPVNTVFQSYALFPHMSVFDNVAFGLRIRKVPRLEIAKRVDEMLGLVNLPNFGQRTIASLSGGEKQRIALARALVNRPQILLLDEPLGALDLQLRRRVQFEIKEIHRKVATTFIYVTHDQEEALALSDRIAVLSEGKIEQVGTPQEIYDQPDSRFVAHFIGSSNLFEGTIHSRTDDDRSVDVDISGLGLVRAIVRNGSGPGDRVGLLLRPEKVEIVHDNARAQGMSAIVEETLYLGPFIRYRLRVSDEVTILAVQHLSAQRSTVAAGQRVRVRWSSKDLVVVER